MKHHAGLISAIILTALFLSLAALSGCDGKKGREYIIYTSDNEPFSFTDSETGKRTGLDIELLDAIARDQGFRYSLVSERSDRLADAAAGGQADGLMSGLAMTHELTETLDFSKGYFDDGLVLVVAADSETEGLSDLSGATLACMSDSAAAEYAKGIDSSHKLEIELYEGYSPMYAAVQRGFADALIEQRSHIGWAIRAGSLEMKIIGSVINPVKYGFAVKKGTNAELLSRFNDGLSNIIGSGEYDEILERYGY